MKSTTLNNVGRIERVRVQVGLSLLRLAVVGPRTLCRLVTELMAY